MSKRTQKDWQREEEEDYQHDCALVSMVEATRYNHWPHSKCGCCGPVSEEARKCAARRIPAGPLSTLRLARVVSAPTQEDHALVASAAAAESADGWHVFDENRWANMHGRHSGAWDATRTMHPLVSKHGSNPPDRTVRDHSSMLDIIWKMRNMLTIVITSVVEIWFAARSNIQFDEYLEVSLDYLTMPIFHDFEKQYNIASTGGIVQYCKKQLRELLPIIQRVAEVLNAVAAWYLIGDHVEDPMCNHDRESSGSDDYRLVMTELRLPWKGQNRHTWTTYSVDKGMRNSTLMHISYTPASSLAYDKEEALDAYRFSVKMCDEVKARCNMLAKFTPQLWLAFMEVRQLPANSYDTAPYITTKRLMECLASVNNGKMPGVQWDTMRLGGSQFLYRDAYRLHLLMKVFCEHTF